MVTSQEANKKVAEITKESGIDKAIMRRILITIEFVMRKANGNPTKFATKYGIMTYKDLYNFFKEVKKNLKKDHESQAFGMLTEAWKSAAARAEKWFMETGNVDNQRDALFYASIFVNRNFGYMLDNLNLLKKVIKMMDEATEEIKTYVAEQKAMKKDRD